MGLQNEAFTFSSVLLNTGCDGAPENSTQSLWEGASP